MKDLKSIINKCKTKRTEFVVIGTSAGGVEALKSILPAFRGPSKLSVAVVIHLPPKGNNTLPDLYQEYCTFKIKEADSGELMRPETIYMAPPNYHLSLEADRTLSLSVEPPCNFSRPSVDFLFNSAAYAFNEKVLGILLTGANNDGARGIKEIKDNDGLCIIQDPKSSLFPTMPQAGLKLMTPDAIMDLNILKDFVKELCRLEGGNDQNS